MISNTLQATDIEFRHLLALKALADEGSFRRAATRLGYTQPAVSQQVARLEHAVGVQLVERAPGRRPATLTAAGQSFLQHSEALLARLSVAVDDAHTHADGPPSKLVVGTYPSVGARLLPPVLRTFRRDCPGVDVVMVESPSDNALLELLERGQVNLAFVILPVRDGPFAVRELLTDPYVLVVARESDIGLGGKAVPLETIGQLPLVEFRHSEDRMAHWLLSAGREAQIVFRTDDNSTLAAVVAAGIGVAVVPRLSVDTHSGVRVLATRPSLEPRRIALAWHAERVVSPAAKTFVRKTVTAARRMASHL